MFGVLARTPEAAFKVSVDTDLNAIVVRLDGGDRHGQFLIDERLAYDSGYNDHILLGAIDNLSESMRYVKMLR